MQSLGRRVERNPLSVGGTQGIGATRFLYDGADVIEDLDEGNRVIISYINGPGIDNKVRQTDGNGNLYYLTDQLGSTNELTDDGGNVVEGIGYDSFGNSTGTSLTRYTYTGREFDSVTDLYYYRARWYDPQVGRFISEDPIGLNGGINPYAYVGNNPIGWRDPLGLQQFGPQDGPVNYLNGLTNGKPNDVSDFLMLDYMAVWAWEVGDPCNPVLYRVWVAIKIVGATATIAMSARSGVRGGRGGGRGRGGYMPYDTAGKPIPLPKQSVRGVDIPTPLPEAVGPHTTLGTRIGSNGIPYRQSAEFRGSSFPKANGQDVPLSRVDWTTHGRADHTNPHQHIYSLTGPGGTWRRGPHTPFWRSWP